MDENTRKVIQLDNFGFANEFTDERGDKKATATEANADTKGRGKRDQSSVRGVLSSFTQEAGLTGVRFIGSKGVAGPRRFIWVIIVLLALGGLLYHLSTLVISFAGHPVNVNVKYEEPIVRPKFPAVTICNNNMFTVFNLPEGSQSVFYVLNWYNHESINDLGYTSLIEAVGGSLSSLYTVVIPYLYVVFPTDGEEFYDRNLFVLGNESTYGNNVENLLDFMKIYAHGINDMIRNCSYGGIPCGPENFTQTVTNYGICYTFNSAEMSDTVRIRNSGQQYGLKLHLHANEREYVGPRNVVGFRLLVHGQDEVPDVAGQGVSISPGTETTIGLTKTVLENLGHPYGNCVQEIENNLTYFNGVYSLSKCKTECETEHALKECGCRYYYMPGSSTFCDPYTLDSCYFRSMDKLATQPNACSSCREPCDQTLYKTKLSYSTYPSYPYAYLTYYFGRWPCDEALGTYLQNHSPLYRTIEAYQVFRTETLPNKYFTIEHNGMNITTFLPRDELHTGMIDTLTEVVYTEIYQHLFFAIFPRILVSITQGEEDAIGSQFYNETFESLKSFKMNFDYEPWITYSLSIEHYLNLNKTNSSTIDVDFYTTTLFYGYHLPLYEELFPILYIIVKDYRDTRATELLQNEDIVEICQNYMKKNLAKVTIYFEHLKVENIIQQPAYESFNLICDIGGSLGLFFGASMVTFLEIIDFFIVQFWLMKMVNSRNTYTGNQ